MDHEEIEVAGPTAASKTGEKSEDREPGLTSLRSGCQSQQLVGKLGGSLSVTLVGFTPGALPGAPGQDWRKSPRCFWQGEGERNRSETDQRSLSSLTKAHPQGNCYQSIPNLGEGRYRTPALSRRKGRNRSSATLVKVTAHGQMLSKRLSPNHRILDTSPPPSSYHHITKAPALQ